MKESKCTKCGKEMSCPELEKFAILMFSLCDECFKQSEDERLKDNTFYQNNKTIKFLKELKNKILI